MLDIRRAASPERGILERAHKKAEGFLRRHVIHMEDFEDLYGAPDVKKDAERVSETRRRIEEGMSAEEKEAKKLADILEVIIHEQILEAGWLGPSARAIKTTPFDDIVNGVDEVVEFDEPPRGASHLALSLDITFGTGLRSKFERVRHEIDSGKLARVKYFKSRGFRGEKTHLPRVVVGTERRHVLELARLWVDDGKGQTLLKQSPFRRLLLKEIALELKAFSEYAHKGGKEDAVLEYDRAHAIITAVSDRQDAFAHSDEWSDDRVCAAIERHARGFTPTPTLA